MLDTDPFDGICIIGAPDLRCVVQNTHIETSAATTAALETNLRKGRGELLHQLIEAEHITVTELTLSFCRQCL